MFPDRLIAERLVLRPPAEGDAERLADLANNWNVARYLTRLPFPYSREDAAEFLARKKDAEHTAVSAIYAITMDDRFAGVIGVDPQKRGPNLGYWLGEPYWGQGLMTEAVGAVVAAFFAAPVNDLLTSGIIVGNDASLAIQRKFGFEVVDEGTIMCLPRKAEVPHVNTALSRRRYEEFTQ